MLQTQNKLNYCCIPDYGATPLLENIIRNPRTHST